jgi:hypothetical protein
MSLLRVTVFLSGQTRCLPLFQLHETDRDQATGLALLAVSQTFSDGSPAFGARTHQPLMLMALACTQLEKSVLSLHATITGCRIKTNQWHTVALCLSQLVQMLREVVKMCHSELATGNAATKVVFIITLLRTWSAFVADPLAEMPHTLGNLLGNIMDELLVAGDLWGTPHTVNQRHFTARQ